MQSARVLNQEREFRLDELFFSITNLQGVIQHGNSVFTRISGYSEEDLFGAPHSIIRHPDMPRVVFKLLWDTIKSGQTIAAYVKNLAKDGRYYWVLAVVMPCQDGYLSIRLKPTSELFPTVIDLYGKLRKTEFSIELEPKQRLAAMEASAKVLNESLRQLGFANYCEFMLHALSLELADRQKALGRNHATRESCMDGIGTSYQDRLRESTNIDSRLQCIFDRLDEFKSVSVGLEKNSQAVLRSAESIRTLSMNATISANKLGNRAATLRVVAESLGVVSNESQSIITELSAQMKTVIHLLNQLIFDVAATKLQSEIVLSFIQEIMNEEPSEHSTRLEHSMTILLSEMAARIKKIFINLRGAEQAILLLQTQLEKLNRNTRTLRFVQFAGEKESVASIDAESFSVVFQEVRVQVDSAKQQCESLCEAIIDALIQIRKLETTREYFGQSLACLARTGCLTFLESDLSAASISTNS